MSSSIKTIRIDHGKSGQMVIMCEGTLTRKKAFGCFMALSELFSNKDVWPTDVYSTNCVGCGCDININQYEN